MLCIRGPACAQAYPADVAWEFFDACATGKLEKAWQMTAPIVRSRKDISILKAAVEKLDLAPSTFWTWRNTPEGLPYTSATGITTHADGTKSEVTVNLVQSNGAWLVYSIVAVALKVEDLNRDWAYRYLLGPCDSLTDALDFEMPSNSDIHREFQKRVEEIGPMMKHPEFTPAYNRARKAAQDARHTSLVEVAFRLKERGVDLDRASRGEWAMPFKREINEDANLVVSSTCEIAGHRLDMAQKFYLSVDGWKYWSFHMDLLPKPDEVKTFAREVLERFNEAIQKESFREFYKSISAKWRRDVSVRQLNNAFHQFWDKKIKLPTSAEIVVLQQPRMINDEISAIAGYINLTEQRAWFEMKLIYENPEWRLYGLNIVIKHPEGSPPDFIKVEK
jgi:hypothetical protein